jgi:hypothetical protein
MKSNNKNLVYICFADKEHRELLDLLNDLKKDYNFEIETHKLGEACSTKGEYNKRIFLNFAEKEDEMRRLEEEHQKYKDKMKNDYVLLVAHFDPSKWVSKFDAKESIFVKDIKTSRNDFKRIFDKVFQVSGTQVGKEQYETKGQQYVPQQQNSDKQSQPQTR